MEVKTPGWGAGTGCERAPGGAARRSRRTKHPGEFAGLKPDGAASPARPEPTASAPPPAAPAPASPPAQSSPACGDDAAQSRLPRTPRDYLGAGGADRGAAERVSEGHD